MKLRHAAALARMQLMSGITRWLRREAEMAGWYRLYFDCDSVGTDLIDVASNRRNLAGARHRN
jgi:hypothetical protein